MASQIAGKRASLASVRAYNTGETLEKTAQKMPPRRSKASLGNVTISNQGSWSLTGLLAARRMTKKVKERRALKGAKKTEIVEPQPPYFASRPPEKIQIAAIKRILESYLPERFGNITYNPELAPSLVKEVTEEVKGRVKRVLPARYKALCLVTLGERGQEDIMVVSRCLWDPHSDNYVAHVYENTSIFCVAAVYTVFCE
ncbi:dynein light chain Tctex-type protein 2B-like [Rhinophrynus dorsalis]